MISEKSSQIIVQKKQLVEEEGLVEAKLSKSAIADKDWDQFLKNGYIGEEVLKSIADRLSQGEKLPDREQKVYDFRTEQIDRLVRENEQAFIAESEAKITQYESPKSQKDLVPEDKQPEAAQIDNESGLQLGEIKKDSLNKISSIKEKIVLKVGAIDVSDVVAGRSRRVADEKMTADKKELKGLKGFLKKIWNYNYAEQVTHEKKRVEAKSNILKEQNIYSNEDLTPEEKVQAGKNFNRITIERFISDAQNLIETELGESREELRSETADEKQIKASLKHIIDEYAEGKLDEAAFEGKKREIFSGLEKIKSQQTHKKGEMYVDNFLEVAKQVKELKDNMSKVAGHQVGIDQLDYEISLVLGKAKDGIKTEAHYNWAEKTIENLRKTKFGSLVNETTLAVGVAATYSAFTGVGKVIGSRSAAAVTFGLSAGVSSVFAAVKESQMQKRERRTLEVREAVQTGTVRESLDRVKKDIADLERLKATKKDKRSLKKIDKDLKSLKIEEKNLSAREKYIYERKTAAELIAGLDQAIKAGKLPELQAEVVEAEARLSLSNHKKIDLVGYSSLVQVEQERIDLLKTVSRAKQEIHHLAQVEGVSAEDAKKKIQTAIDLRIDELSNDKGGLQEKDKEFNRHRRKAVLKKLVNNFVVGLGVGVVAQEAISFVTDHQEGLVENMIKGNGRTLGSHDTALEAIKNYIAGSEVAEQLQSVVVENGTISLPASCAWVANPNGSFDLMRGTDVIAAGLSLNPDGSLTEEAKELLAASSVNVSAAQNFVDQGTSLTTVTSSPEEYLAQHPDNVTEVSRQRWYANDTEMYLGEDGKWHGADLNERRLDFGGDNNSGINSQTNAYEMSAFRMTADGSFQTVSGVRLSDDAAELIKQGKMSILFSLSAETQNQVIEIPIDPKTGAASIPRDSDLGRLLFSEEGGRAVLKARFAEVAMTSAETEAGVKQVRVFATAVGEGMKDVSTTIAEANDPLITTNTALGVDRSVIMPPFLPLGARTPLEKMSDKALLYNIYSAAPVESARRHEMDKRRSASLEADPNAFLDHYQEAKQYFDRLDSNYLEDVRSLAQEAGPMADGNKLSICIPVAGHQEGEKIYESLKNYTYQDADPANFEICLLVNHPDRDLEDNKISPDQTLSEIERFKKDFPNYNIRVMYKVLPREQAKIGLARKLLSDAVLLRHHERGRQADDLIMVSNDADNLGVDPRYVSNFLNRFKENPKVDGVLGQIDWDPEAYVKYPLVHIGTRLFQYYSAYGRAKRGGIVSSGANFAYRSSIYAAVGGYLDSEAGGEDVAFGQAIALARGDSRTGERGLILRHNHTAIRLPGYLLPPVGQSMF